MGMKTASLPTSTQIEEAIDNAANVMDASGASPEVVQWFREGCESVRLASQLG